MRLATGDTATCNIAKLFEETGWMCSAEEQDQSVLIMAYTVKNGLVLN